MSRQARGWSATVTGIAVLVGISIGNPFWVLFGTIALIVIGLAEAWWRWGGVGLEYRRTLAATTATCGDTIDCVIEVTNRKVLPMPWVDVADDWPSALLPDRARGRHRGWGTWTRREVAPGSATKDALNDLSTNGMRSDHEDVPTQVDREPLAQRLTLAPFERVQRRYAVPCRRRGAYAFGPVAIRWRDAFGLTSRDADMDSRGTLVVFPRVVPVVAPPGAVRQLLGDRVQPRALLADPTRLAGVRPFTSGDSVRRVHWGATARTGVLQVRRDDPTAGRRLWLVIDVETATEDRWWSAGDSDVHETLAIVAASVAAWALGQGVSVGVSANGRTAGSAIDLSVPCAGNPRQLLRVLDALARLRPWPSRMLRETLEATGRTWPRDATVVLVTAMPSIAKASALARAARHGQPSVMIDCRPARAGQASDPVGMGTTWRLADAAAPWQSRAEVRLG